MTDRGIPVAGFRTYGDGTPRLCWILSDRLHLIRPLRPAHRGPNRLKHTIRFELWEKV